MVMRAVDRGSAIPGGRLLLAGPLRATLSGYHAVMGVWVWLKQGEGVSGGRFRVAPLFQLSR